MDKIGTAKTETEKTETNNTAIDRAVIQTTTEWGEEELQTCLDRLETVSYTHLDVYKRQVTTSGGGRGSRDRARAAAVMPPNTFCALILFFIQLSCR